VFGEGGQRHTQANKQKASWQALLSIGRTHLVCNACHGGGGRAILHMVPSVHGCDDIVHPRPEIPVVKGWLLEDRGWVTAKMWVVQNHPRHILQQPGPKQLKCFQQATGWSKLFLAQPTAFQALLLINNVGKDRPLKLWRGHYGMTHGHRQLARPVACAEVHCGAAIRM